MPDHPNRTRPRGRRRDHPFRPELSDESARRPADAVVCDDCNLVHHGGRWYRGAPPLGDVQGGLCPACRRVRERQPAGTLVLPAAQALPRDELLALVRHVEQAETDTHPLERVMAVEVDGDDIRITTTGVHLARRLVARLQRRLHDRPAIHFGEGPVMTATWGA